MNEDIVKKAQAMAEDFTYEGKSSLGVGSFVSSVNFAPVLLSDLTSENEDIVWLWEGFLAKGHLTLLSAYWKAGKSTLIAQLLKAMQGGKELAGKSTTPCKVLILSEESQSLWVRRRDELDIQSVVWVMSRPIKQRLVYNEWVGLLKKTSEFCKENSVDLVIVDTISGFWSVQDENDASKVHASLLPLNYLLEQQISVLLVHHFRKSGGEEGTAARGSGVLSSTADIIIEFKRREKDNPSSHNRVIQTLSRFEESPREVIIDLVDGEYITLGTLAEVSKQAKLSYLLSLLPTAPNGLTSKEIVEEWDSEEAGIKKPGKRTIQNYLSDLQGSGKVSIVEQFIDGKAKIPRYGKTLDSKPSLEINNESNERPLPIRDFPRSNACYTCGSTKKWRRFDGGLVCAVCHPPASEEDVKEWIEV